MGRAAWRIITSIEQKEKTKGNGEQAQFAREYCQKVETELDQICSTILELLNGNLLDKASSDESKVFYHKMKADYYRYIAEFKTDDAKKAAAESSTTWLRIPTRIPRSSCSFCATTLLSGL